MSTHEHEQEHKHRHRYEHRPDPGRENTAQRGHVGHEVRLPGSDVGKMVAMSAHDSPPTGRGSHTVLHPPLWARWLLAIAGFAVLIVVIAVVVRSVNHGSSGGSASEPKAEAEANREGQIVVEQDQAPHTATLHTGAGATMATTVALERAITADVHARIDDGQLTGPLQSVHCREAGSPRGGRQPFHCTVRSAGIEYPFLAVADPRSKTLTWCKFDPPPEPGVGEVPVSARCRV